MTSRVGSDYGIDSKGDLKLGFTESQGTRVRPRGYLSCPFCLLRVVPYLPVFYLTSALWMPGSLVVHPQHGVMFRETAVHQNYIIQSNTNLYSASKEKAKGVKCIPNERQDIFKIHHSPSLLFSVSSTQRAAASWNLTLLPTPKARPKTLHDMKPAWFTPPPPPLSSPFCISA